MKQRILKLGTLGFGAMGKTHAYAVKNLPFFCSDLPFRAELFGVATRDVQKAKNAASTYGIPFATASEDEIIYHKDVDIVDVCTPNHCHFNTVKKALLAGKHVYCEKPLCTTYAEAKELSDLAKKAGVTAAIVFNNRHLAAVKRAKELIDEGKIGRILHFEVQYLHNSCIDKTRTAGWKQDADICGEGGVLFDLGSHALDLAVLLCGELATVWGKSQIAYPTHKKADGSVFYTNAPEAFYMQVTTKTGAVGTITASKLTMGANDELSFAIYGERGALRFSLMQPNYLYFYDAEVPGGNYGGSQGFTAIECVGRYENPAGTFPSPKAPTGWLAGHVMSMYHFLSAVYEGRSATPDFAHGAYIQYLMELALASAADGTEKAVML